jgi:hypothetical protein
MKKIILLFSFLMFSLSNAQLIDVWDFGATQLNNATYNNMLNENAINAWYSGVTPGTNRDKFAYKFYFWGFILGRKFWG